MVSELKPEEPKLDCLKTRRQGTCDRFLEYHEAFEDFSEKAA